MKLSEEHIFKGYWWLPENPNNKVAGILTYTPGERMCLELLGGFENAKGEYIGLFDEDNKSIPLIYGKDSNAKEITLVDCRSSFSLNFSADFPVMRYSARMLVFDKHLGDFDERCEYTAYIRFPELSQWAPPGAIEQIVSFDEEGKDIKSSTFILPTLRGEEGVIFSVTCENDVQVSICRSIAYNSGELSLKPELEQYSYLEIKKPGVGLSIPEIFHELNKFQQFLSLVTKRNVQYETIYLKDPDIYQDFGYGQKIYYFPIYILTVQKAVFNPVKLNRDKFLFRYEDMPDRISCMLVKWMSDSDNLQPIKNHLVDSLLYKPTVGSVDFLQVVQAIEGVWWRFREDEYRVVNNVPKRKKTTLTTIFQEILKALSDISKVSSVNLDVEAVVDSRNYYSHFVDKSKKPKTLDGLQLYDLTRQLRTILLCLVFELLGLSHTEINMLLTKQR